MTYVVSGQGSEADISITEAMINGNEAFTHDLMQHMPSHCERMLVLAQELNTLTMEACSSLLNCVEVLKSQTSRQLTTAHCRHDSMLLLPPAARSRLLGEYAEARDCRRASGVKSGGTQRLARGRWRRGGAARRSQLVRGPHLGGQRGGQPSR